MSIRRLQQILTREPVFADFVARRDREAALGLQVHRALPAALAGHVQVADAATEALVLVTTSGAAAGLVRQRIPVILDALAGEGWKFTGIRVRVQPRPASRPVQKRIAKQLDTESAQRLFALAATLSNTSLKAALRRLASNASDEGDADHAIATSRSKA